MQRTHSTLLLSVLLAAPGCGSLDVHLLGTLETTGTSKQTGELVFDTAGNPSLRDGQQLFLPRGQELRRYGVTLADTSGVPAGWLPKNAEASPVVVAAIDRASPLAIAGLRKYDRIRSINGKRATLRRVLRALKEEDSVSLEVIHFKGPTVTLEAEASDDINDIDIVALPFLFESNTSSTGSGLGLGPFDGLFYYRSATLVKDGGYPEFDDVDEGDIEATVKQARALLAEVERSKYIDEVNAEIGRTLAKVRAAKQAIAALEKTPASPWRERNLARLTQRRELLDEMAEMASYKMLNEIRAYEQDHHVERFEWGCFFNLFLYQRTRDLVTGREHSRFRLFWFLSFGDDDAADV